TKYGTDRPGKIEKRDCRGCVLGRKLCSTKVDGGIGKSVTEAIDSEHQGRNEPRTETQESKTNKEGDESDGRNLRKTESGKKEAGENHARRAEKILRGEEKTSLGVSQQPMMRKGRQNRAQQRRNYTDDDKTEVQERPFTARILRRR
ncbi:MAG TPA: hypothetical protein VJX72_01390, partial [Candidatus Acidoferrum sp.]|nr:hypothetical protein [Candidatus Acidoferrum sp.]